MPVNADQYQLTYDGEVTLAGLAFQQPVVQHVSRHNEGALEAVTELASHFPTQVIIKSEMPPGGHRRGTLLGIAMPAMTAEPTHFVLYLNMKTFGPEELAAD